MTFKERALSVLEDHLKCSTGEDRKEIENCMTLIRWITEESRWIPVKERMPQMHEEILDDGDKPCRFEESDSVLVYAKNGETAVCIANRMGEELYWVDESGTSYEATHWMPLPIPPQEGSKNEAHDNIMSREMIDVEAAQEHVSATYHNDPLLQHLYRVFIEKLPKVTVEVKDNG